MPLDDEIRDRVTLRGGKVTGVDCPECQFDGGDVGLDEHSMEAVTCPNCGSTVLTPDEKSQLRRAGKL